MRNESVMLVLAVSMAALVLGACVMHGEVREANDTSQIHEIMAEEANVDMVEFELVRGCLYDCAMTICTSLAECDGSCFYTDVDKVYVEIFKTHRVPSLEALLTILDQIDEKGSLHDVYDDDECTLDSYYIFRERYESFF